MQHYSACKCLHLAVVTPARKVRPHNIDLLDECGIPNTEATFTPAREARSRLVQWSRKCRNRCYLNAMHQKNNNFIFRNSFLYEPHNTCIKSCSPNKARSGPVGMGSLKITAPKGPPRGCAKRYCSEATFTPAREACIMSYERH